MLRSTPAKILLVWGGHRRGEADISALPELDCTGARSEYEVSTCTTIPLDSAQAWHCKCEIYVGEQEATKSNCDEDAMRYKMPNQYARIQQLTSSGTGKD